MSALSVSQFGIFPLGVQSIGDPVSTSKSTFGGYPFAIVSSGVKSFLMNGRNGFSPLNIVASAFPFPIARRRDAAAMLTSTDLIEKCLIHLPSIPEK